MSLQVPTLLGPPTIWGVSGFQPTGVGDDIFAPIPTLWPTNGTVNTRGKATHGGGRPTWNAAKKFPKRTVVSMLFNSGHLVSSFALPHFLSVSLKTIAFKLGNTA